MSHGGSQNPPPPRLCYLYLVNYDVHRIMVMPVMIVKCYRLDDDAVQVAGAPAPPEMIAAPLPEDTRQELLKSEWYQEELEVYEFAMKLHQRQLVYAREHTGGHGGAGSGGV